jgi:hypothetical protein
MSDIEIRAEREAPETHLLYSTAEEGTVTITLPGLTAIRIDPKTRTIAIDTISGHPRDPESLAEWFVADLRNGTYGDFHRLRPGHECNDPECGPSQHNALYPHFHETTEDVSDCQPCIDRAADLRYLADV